MRKFGLFLVFGLLASLLAVVPSASAVGGGCVELNHPDNDGWYDSWLPWRSVEGFFEAGEVVTITGSDGWSVDYPREGPFVGPGYWTVMENGETFEYEIPEDGEYWFKWRGGEQDWDVRCHAVPDTVSGVVTLGGTPLSGVEVSILDPDGFRHACTDESGYYEFPEIGEYHFVATGPSFTLAPECTNPKFVDPDGMTPLQVAITDDGGYAPATIDFDVEPLPDDHRGIYNSMRSALNTCYERGVPIHDRLQDISGRIESADLTDPIRDAYFRYLDLLYALGDNVCPMPSILVVGQDDPENIPALLAEFEAFTIETGIPVEYQQTDDPGGIEDHPGDVTLLGTSIFLNEPELVHEYLVDLGTYRNPKTLRADYGDYLIDHATVDGAILGLPIQLVPKTLVWYRPDVFTAKGYEIPTTLSALEALSSQMVSDGYTPWCNYIGSSWATGWIGTDWIEDLMLGKHGPAVYDAWQTNAIPFTDPTVEWAADTYKDFIDTPDWVYDRGGMLGTHFSENAGALLDGNCLMHRQAAFFAGFLGEGFDQVDTFKFPAASTQYRDAVMGSGLYAAAMTDSQPVRQFMRFLSSDRFGTSLASGEALTWILPNTRFNTASYTHPAQRQWAEMTNRAQRADMFRFDASDHMPWNVNLAFWDGITQIAEGAPVAQVLEDIENTWHPNPELTPVEWFIMLDDWGPGIHTIFTVVEAHPLTPDQIAEMSGRLVWNEVVVDLCNIHIRDEGEDYVLIGDGYQTTEGCGDNPDAMQEAFDANGIPIEACLTVTTIDAVTHEYCAPLEEYSNPPAITVLLPDGQLFGDGFIESSSGFEFLYGEDATNEDNWFEWTGTSAEDGSLMVEGAAVGAGADEWVGIRHTSAGQEAVLQIVSFTFDYWNGDTASGTVDDEGEVMVCWWDPDDPENNNACAESTITDGIWEVTGLGGEPHFDPLAYRWDDDGDSQVIRPTS